MKSNRFSKNDVISAVEIVREYELSYQTVNYYTNLGLLDVVGNKGNKRLYNRDDVETRLEKIKKMKKRGYPLRLIRDELLSNFRAE